MISRLSQTLALSTTSKPVAPRSTLLSCATHWMPKLLTCSSLCEPNTIHFASSVENSIGSVQPKYRNRKSGVFQRRNNSIFQIALCETSRQYESSSQNSSPTDCGRQPTTFGLTLPWNGQIIACTGAAVASGILNLYRFPPPRDAGRYASRLNNHSVRG